MVLLILFELRKNIFKERKILAIFFYHLFTSFFLMKLKLLTNRENTIKQTILVTMTDFYLVFSDLHAVPPFLCFILPGLMMSTAQILSD
jgi:hypothetical protein